MGITKLMHMKESTPTPHTHLRNAINYILNKEKTKNGELVGGNAGLESREILNTFLETKGDFGKYSGRQGYHFVISFEKGTADERTAYEIVREFCEEYLGDNYDYVFAVHNDKEHMHGHIIFNSVSRTTGNKYYYKNGDWAKYIQPITDKLCENHGLEPLIFENERIGESYAAWASKKENGFNWKDILRADIDFAITKSNSYDEFKDVLQKMGYTLGREGLRQGVPYLSLKAEGMARSWRTTSLGDAYNLSAIKIRIKNDTGPRSFEELTRKMNEPASAYLQSTMFRGNKSFRRLYQTVNYYQLPNPYAIPAYKVRKDMLNLDEIINECKYIKEHNLTSENSIHTRMQTVTQKLASLYTERNTIQGVLKEISLEENTVQREYELLQRQLLMAEESHDDIFEELDDQIKELENHYPRDWLMMPLKLKTCNKEISALKKEEKILKGFIEERFVKSSVKKIL